MLAILFMPSFAQAYFRAQLTFKLIILKRVLTMVCFLIKKKAQSLTITHYKDSHYYWYWQAFIVINWCKSKEKQGAMFTYINMVCARANLQLACPMKLKSRVQDLAIMAWNSNIGCKIWQTRHETPILRAEFDNHSVKLESWMQDYTIMAWNSNLECRIWQSWRETQILSAGFENHAVKLKSWVQNSTIMRWKLNFALRMMGSSINQLL